MKGFIIGTMKNYSYRPDYYLEAWYFSSEKKLQKRLKLTASINGGFSTRDMKMFSDNMWDKNPVLMTYDLTE